MEKSKRQQQSQKRRNYSGTHFYSKKKSRKEEKRTKKRSFSLIAVCISLVNMLKLILCFSSVQFICFNTIALAMKFQCGTANNTNAHFILLCLLLNTFRFLFLSHFLFNIFSFRRFFCSSRI